MYVCERVHERMMRERNKHKRREREREKSNNSRVMIMETYHYGKFKNFDIHNSMMRSINFGVDSRIQYTTQWSNWRAV